MKMFGLFCVAAAFMFTACVADANAKPKGKGKGKGKKGYQTVDLVITGTFYAYAGQKFSVTPTEKYKGDKIWGIHFTQKDLKNCDELPDGDPKDWNEQEVKISCNLTMQPKDGNQLKVIKVNKIKSIILK